MKLSNILLVLGLSILSVCCNKDKTDKSTGNNADSAVFALPDDACTFFQTKLTPLFNLNPQDLIGDCENLENQFGAKTNFLYKNLGIAVYLSAIPSKLNGQDAIDDYYNKYFNIPNLDVDKVEGVGQGAIWLEKQKMLSFTEGEYTFTLICSSINEEEDYNKNLAVTIANGFIDYGKQ